MKGHRTQNLTKQKHLALDLLQTTVIKLNPTHSSKVAKRPRPNYPPSEIRFKPTQLDPINISINLVQLVKSLMVE